MDDPKDGIRVEFVNGLFYSRCMNVFDGATLPVFRRAKRQLTDTSIKF